MDYNFPIPEYEEKLPNTRKVESFPNTNSNVEKVEHSKTDSIPEKIEQYLNSYSESTKIAYASDLKDFWDYSGKTLQETTENDVLRYIKDLERRGYANSSINRKLASLSKIMKIYVAMKLMSYNPISNLSALGKLYKPVKKTKELSITLNDIRVACNRANNRTKLIIMMLTNSGIRVSELINIKKEDINPHSDSHMKIMIHGKGGKLRYIYVSYMLYQEIKDVYDGNSIYLFASKSDQQLSRVNLYKQIRRAFKKYCNVDCSPHDLRHFFATEKLITEKKDYKAVSQYLGHASISTTLQFYTHSNLSPEETSII